MKTNRTLLALALLPAFVSCSPSKPAQQDSGVATSSLLYEGGHLRFPPSNAPVETVILSHKRTLDDKREEMGFPDPRMDLIKDLSTLFPSLDIRVSISMPKASFFEKYPELSSRLSQVVEVEMSSIQDPLEFAYDDDGNLVVLGLDMFRGYYKNSRGLLDLFPQTSRLFLDKADKSEQSDLWRKTVVATRFAGGNIEFLPDGTPLLGKNTPKDIIAWFKAQHGDVVTVDSGWTSTGDLDELLLLTNDPRGKKSCLLFYADLMAGSELFKKRFSEIEGRNELASLPDETCEYYKKKFKEILDGQVHIAEAAKVLASDVAHIMSHPSMSNCESIALPALYYEFDESFAPKEYQYRFGSDFASPLNSLVIDNHVFMLEVSDSIQETVKETLERYDFKVHAYTRAAFDGGGGYMHCSTNTVRKMLPLLKK